jgi:hypothetical protein
MTATGLPRFLTPAEARARIRAIESGIDLQAEQVARGGAS